MNKDVEEYIQTCTVCQKTKHSTRKTPGLLQPINAEYPWQIITMDFVGGFAPGILTGNTMCLVIVDKFSKYIILESVPATVDAEQTADILMKRMITQFGIPEKVITDRGPQFAANLWQKVLTFLGSKPALAATHHPQTDGQSERTIQTLNRLISAFASDVENKWEELLPLLQFSLNDAFCESTASTPFRVLYGCDPVSPMRLISRSVHENPNPEQPLTPTQWEEQTVEQLSKVWDFIKEHQEEVAQRMKERYDKNRRHLELQPGDLVLVSTKSHRLLEGHRKHRQRFVGPYVVQTKINDNAYKLTGLPPGMPTTQNVEYLKLFKPSPHKFRMRPTPEANLPEIIQGEPEWEVEKIENDRGTRGNYSFLVKWAHTPQRQWLPLRNLNNCCGALKDYYQNMQMEIPELVQKFINENNDDDGNSQDEDNNDNDNDDANVEQNQPDQQQNQTNPNST